MRKAFLALLLLGVAARPMRAQSAPEGLWQGYDGEWRHVSSQLIALAEATPEEKFAWRPAPGVRSTSEVYMHIVMANFYLLSVTGPKMPVDLKEGMDKSVTSKAEVINWLKRSLDAVKQAHSAVTPKDLQRRVHIEDRDATVDGMYLRIIVHANEHMGQLVAYARMTGVVPPWSGKLESVNYFDLYVNVTRISSSSTTSLTKCTASQLKRQSPDCLGFSTSQLERKGRAFLAGNLRWPCREETSANRSG